MVSGWPLFDDRICVLTLCSEDPADLVVQDMPEPIPDEPEEEASGTTQIQPPKWPSSNPTPAQITATLAEWFPKVASRWPRFLDTQ